MQNIHTLNQREVALKQTMDALHAKLIQEDRDFTAEERKTWDDTRAKRKLNQEAVARTLEMLQEERNTPAVEDENAAAAQRAISNPPPGVKGKGFNTLGEQMQAVVQAARSDGRLVDPRLVQAAAAGASESVPSDGGFAVQIDFQQGILERMYSDGEILDRLERIPISPNANGVKINAVDEDSRVDGSRWGGLQAFWANEADPYTASKAKYSQIELRLNKLTG